MLDTINSIILSNKSISLFYFIGGLRAALVDTLAALISQADVMGYKVIGSYLQNQTQMKETHARKGQEK